MKTKTFLILLFIGSYTFSQTPSEYIANEELTTIDLVTKHLFDNKVSVKVPSTFKQLSKKELVSHFSRADSPEAAFVDETNSIYVTLVLEQTKKATQEYIEKYKDYYVEKYNYFGKCNDSGIFNNNTKKYGFVAVDGFTLKQKPIYLTLSFTDIAGMVLECKFYCPANKKEQWKEIANKIIKSFTVTMK